MFPPQLRRIEHSNRLKMWGHYIYVHKSTDSCNLTRYEQEQGYSASILYMHMHISAIFCNIHSKTHVENKKAVA